jgi:hypothetical protein
MRTNRKKIYVKNANLKKMDGIGYVDGLLNDYFIFRGFLKSFDIFEQEKETNSHCNYDSKKIINYIINLIESGQLFVFLQFWKNLNEKYLFLTPVEKIKSYETSFFKYFIIANIFKGNMNGLFSFFTHFSNNLFEMPEWIPWCRVLGYTFSSYMVQPSQNKLDFIPSTSDLPKTHSSFNSEISGVANDLPFESPYRFPLINTSAVLNVSPTFISSLNIPSDTFLASSQHIDSLDKIKLNYSKHTLLISVLTSFPSFIIFYTTPWVMILLYSFFNFLNASFSLVEIPDILLWDVNEQERGRLVDENEVLLHKVNKLRKETVCLFLKYVLFD